MTGGNHLENLLSTCDQFEKKISSDNKTVIDLLIIYQNKSQLLTKQINNDTDLLSNGFNVHAYEIQTVFNNVYNNIQNYLNYKKILVVHSHSDVYEWHLHQIKMKNIFFQYLNRTNAIIMSVPKNISGRAYKRYEKYFLKNSSVLAKPSENYLLPYTIAGFELFNDSNARLLDADLFMSDDGWEYISNFLQSNFNILLAPETKLLHELWIKMIDQSLTAK